MPDSNITKKALAMAMKELMEQIPFSKISVSDICEKCGMNRKSFYYHFKDKYDLVNWILMWNFSGCPCRDYNLPNWSWRFLEDSCQYFYENQSFYRKALQIEGQNSFVEHFRETLKPLLKMVVKIFWQTRNMKNSASIFIRMHLLRRWSAGCRKKNVQSRNYLLKCCSQASAH